ncbi:uncharacterized protein [Dermacentor albipictus]|uniref:uncharacterized protein n=1 Tax=Dermacentor albipictus TaxID=60249 RepID=UPI0038FCED7C
MTKAGRKILDDLGIRRSNEVEMKLPVPEEVRRQTRIDPIPKNMNTEFNKGRRAVKAKALIYQNANDEHARYATVGDEEAAAVAVGRIGEYRLGTNASWDEYVERLEMFCEANKIAKEQQKRAVLLSSCGEEAYGLIVTLVKPARPTTATYDEIKTAVRKHLHPKPSELYARFLFYKRNQAAEESVADYVTALRKLAEDCGFGDVQLPLGIMMRDRFVCGLQNEAVHQRLLAEHDLTFKVAYDMAATAEATAKQQRDIRMHGRDEAKDCQGMIQATRTKQDATAEGSSSYRCNGKHAPHLCSFRKAACFKCKRVGHIARACRSKDESRAARKTPEQKRKVEKSKGVYEMSALFSLCEVNEQEQKFIVKVQIQGQVPVEVDSGASCSIVSEDTFRVIERNLGEIPL